MEKNSCSTISSLHIDLGSVSIHSFAEMKFTDVPDDAYYANGVYRLVEKGAISGYGDGRFGPMIL